MNELNSSYRRRIDLGQRRQQRLAVLLAERRADPADRKQLVDAARRRAQHVLEHGVGGDGERGLAVGALVAPGAQHLEAALVDRRAGGRGVARPVGAAGAGWASPACRDRLRQRPLERVVESADVAAAPARAPGLVIAEVVEQLAATARLAGGHVSLDRSVCLPAAVA